MLSRGKQNTRPNLVSWGGAARGAADEEHVGIKLRPDNQQIVWLEEWGFAVANQVGITQTYRCGVASALVRPAQPRLERQQHQLRLMRWAGSACRSQSVART